MKNGASVIAHENVKRNLTKKTNLPGKTYEQDFTVKLGGVEAQLLHFGNARTNGDTIVYFPNLKVVAVGELYESAPIPDYSAGGSLLGWGPVLSRILELDFDVVVP